MFLYMLWALMTFTNLEEQISMHYVIFYANLSIHAKQSGLCVMFLIFYLWWPASDFRLLVSFYDQKRQIYIISSSLLYIQAKNQVSGSFH